MATRLLRVPDKPPVLRQLQRDFCDRNVIRLWQSFDEVRFLGSTS